MLKTAVAAALLATPGAYAQPSASAPGAVLMAAATPSLPPAAAAEPGEAQLREAVKAAIWPGDIVQAADAYLQTYPGTADIAAERQGAAQTLKLVRRSDVQIFRSSFTAQDPALTADLRRAARGNPEAAMRLAEASRAHDGANGTHRYVGWMQLASLLGDVRASYKLALHFRSADQPLLAAQYEALAASMGHQPLPALDHVRK